MQGAAIELACIDSKCCVVVESSVQDELQIVPPWPESDSGKANGSLEALLVVHKLSDTK